MLNRHIKQKKTNYVRNIIVLFIAFSFILVILFDIMVRPRISTVMNHEAKVIATKVMSDITYDVIEELGVHYDDIVHIAKDDNDKVATIEVDTIQINKLKTMLTSKTTEAFQAMKTTPYTLTLGTFIGSEYLSGRGPDIRFYIEPRGYLKTELISKFTSVGINHTHHQILLNMTVDLTTILPLHNSTVELQTNFVVAETVIVGEVPQYYTSVITNDKSLVSDINDYSPSHNK